MDELLDYSPSEDRYDHEEKSDCPSPPAPRDGAQFGGSSSSTSVPAPAPAHPVLQDAGRHSCQDKVEVAALQEAPSRLQFVKRSPEEYCRPVLVESTLTARLRRQAGKDTSYPDRCRQEVSFFNDRKTVEINVHLPPYDEESVATLTVPAAMVVADLKEEVLRQRGAAALECAAAYELRLYDEEEREPDYECPVFHRSLQVGRLNVVDVALCPVGARSEPSTPPSPPVQSLLEQASFQKLSDSAGTPRGSGPQEAESCFSAKSSQLGGQQPLAELPDEVVFLPARRHRRARSTPNAYWQETSADQATLSFSEGSSLPVLGFMEPERHQPLHAFFFNEYTASLATEYLVTVALKGSRLAPADCTLIVDRERLRHRPASKSDKKASFVPPLLKKLGRSLHADGSRQLFAERCVRNICAVAHEPDCHRRSFSVTYRSIAGDMAETMGYVALIYQAQTPTECAEIVARLHFLRGLTNN